MNVCIFASSYQPCVEKVKVAYPTDGSIIVPIPIKCATCTRKNDYGALTATLDAM